MYCAQIDRREFVGAMPLCWDDRSTIMRDDANNIVPEPAIAALALAMFDGQLVEAEPDHRIRAEYLVTAIGARVFGRRPVSNTVVIE